MKKKDNSRIRAIVVMLRGVCDDAPVAVYPTDQTAAAYKLIDKLNREAKTKKGQERLCQLCATVMAVDGTSEVYHAEAFLVGIDDAETPAIENVGKINRHAIRQLMEKTK